MSKEKEISVGSFPGFKFSPTEEELILYYLKKKIEGFDNCVEVIAEIDITQFEPWDLPAKSILQSDNEWFFFSARGRKYPRGLQSRRATESGYWKATGKERNVKTGSNIIGTKRTLVFHKGRAPKGERTEWIMHEYCMSGTSQDSLVVCRLRRNGEFHCQDTLRKESRRSSPGDISTSAPRKESRHSLPGDSSTSALAEGLQHKGVDGSYKDCSSSANSHSVEHINSECESDHKPANEIFQDGCSSRQKGCDDVDDCFADILNDDIVKLDESSLSTTSDLLLPTEPKIDVKFKEPVHRNMPSMLPSQGTANRRIRLWRDKENFSGGADVQTHSPQSPHCLMCTLSDMLANHHSIILLLILTLLALFVFVGTTLASQRFWS